MAKSATSKKTNLGELIKQHEADPVNRVIAAARKVSEAREEKGHAEIACEAAEYDLENAVIAAAQVATPRPF